MKTQSPSKEIKIQRTTKGIIRFEKYNNQKQTNKQQTKQNQKTFNKQAKQQKREREKN